MINLPKLHRIFKLVQNKLHYAVHRYTAAELIVERASSDKKHMGLTTWESAPDGKILKTDVSIAKNYLNKRNVLSRAHCPGLSRFCRVASRA